MSPVLVTGATGFMGRALVARLLEEGRAVRVLERRPSDAFDGLAVERVTGDVTRPETLRRRLRGRGDRVQPRRRAVLRREGRGAPAGGERRRPGESAGRGAAGRERARRAGLERRRAWATPRTRRVRRTRTPPSRRAPGATATPAASAWARRSSCAPSPRGRTSSWPVPASCSAPATSTASTRSWSRSTCAAILRTTVAGGISSVDVRDVAEGLLAVERRGVSGRRYILTQRGRQSQPPRVLRTRRRGRRQAPPHVPAAAGAPRRRRADRACAAAAGAAQSRGDRGRVPLVVRHAGPGDGRARLPAAPGARGDGGDREVPARPRPEVAQVLRGSR